MVRPSSILIVNWMPSDVWILFDKLPPRVAPIAPPKTAPISDSGFELLISLPAAAPTKPPTIVPGVVLPSILTFFRETTSP